MTPYTIRKPDFIITRDGVRVGTMQERRGGYVVLNFGDAKAVAVETCAMHLTNYGRGTQDKASEANFSRALNYQVGADGSGCRVERVV